MNHSLHVVLRSLIGRGLALCVLFSLGAAGVSAGQATDTETPFRRIPTQFIAALGDPQANAGSGAQTWGLWRVDPGPRGVWLKNFDRLQADDGVAPARWRFDKQDWWVDENGLLMEKPAFPVPPGKYVVTGERETVAILTIYPEDATGDRRWELDRGAVLHDVTHLPCRSARYTSTNSESACSPANMSLAHFPIEPGAIMPRVEACNKQDYWVLFVIGKEVKQ